MSPMRSFCYLWIFRPTLSEFVPNMRPTFEFFSLYVNNGIIHYSVNITNLYASNSIFTQKFLMATKIIFFFGRKLLEEYFLDLSFKTVESMYNFELKRSIGENSFFCLAKLEPKLSTNFWHKFIYQNMRIQNPDRKYF